MLTLFAGVWLRITANEITVRKFQEVWQPLLVLNLFISLIILIRLSYKPPIDDDLLDNPNSIIHYKESENGRI